ncbi:peptide-methionine (S)-S-oxide reductase MsrA [Mollicutes bacterium LVI A0078]|nr:peptide-methionine (S)-S-oxide reductase MsrA [Mollicutes bacterium LVI A0075]WOO90888.1 peptide-methionine (S)-S-oxide reductase MsrA [Mollicutes bacterium LVI A0078]
METVKNPSYEQVCSKTTDFVETVYLKYDSSKITLEKLIDEYFKIIDPTSYNKQGGDVGSQYRTGIYSKDSVELEIAAAKIESLAGDYKKPILVEVKPLENYYRAEDYHQKYLEKNPNGYCHVDLGLLSN